MQVCACGGGGGGNSSGGSLGGNTGSYSISLSQQSLNFNYSLGDSAPPAQVIAVTFDGDGILVGYPANSSQPDWLQIQQADSSDTTSPIDIRFSIITDSLNTGSYSTTIRFATGDINATNGVYKDIPLTLSVNNALALDRQTLSFSHINGAPSAPATQAVNVSGTGINWTATTSQSWLTADASSGTAPSTINLGINPNGLSAGSYSAQLDVTDSITHTTKSVSVSLTLEPHKLFIGDNGVAFSSFPSAPSMLTHSVTIQENAGATVPWAASSNQAWLSATTSGVSGGQLTLTADPSGLGTDTIHYAEVTVTSSDATITDPELIKVGFYVSANDPSATQLSLSGQYLASDPIRPYVYITNEDSDVLVYNIYDGTLVNTLTAGTTLKGLTTASDGSELFVTDAHDNTIIPIDLGNWNIGSKWNASDFSQVNAMLAYLRVNGQAVLITNHLEVFDVASGSEVSPLAHDSIDNYLIAPARDNSSFYLVRPYVSGYADLTRYEASYSDVNGRFALQAPAYLNASFNGITDMAANADGSKIYISSMDNGYSFSTFSYDSTDISETTALPGRAYPRAVELGLNEKLYAGIEEFTASNNDLWSYNSDGTLEDTYTIPGQLVNRAIAISGDGLRMITLSNTPALNFTAITP